ncbi:TadE/TadG family type IV pilus assembly protein [Polymorphobacter multimanifer]|uniref:TadE/TadG family type IV pilus assembly protein n=1 Tax=Polymorphobacter multimanifer TaxID=1070431 RepID=UPI00161B8139
MKKTCSRTVLDACGSVAAEFALVVPLLFSLIFGAFEAASIAFSMNLMQHEAMVLARRLAVNTITPGEIAGQIQHNLPPWLRTHVSYTVAHTDIEQPRLNFITVQLSAAADDASLIVFFSRVLPWTIRATATAKQEVPFDG